MARENNLNQILREEAFDKQGIIDLIRSGAIPGGTNLVQPRTFEYGSYQIPASDPTYTSGFDYARTIAGGIPFEDVVAPGMSFSPDRPMGYTQQDLNFISSGPVPVMPSAPTKGEPLVMEDQMPYAPPGTKEPTIFGQEPAQEVVNLFEGIDKEALSEKIAELNLFNFEDQALSMPPPPVRDMVSTQPAPVMPPAPVTQPMPMPMPMPMPTIPTNLVGLPTFTQPAFVREPAINVEDIVSPIRTGSTRVRTPNLFNVVV